MERNVYQVITNCKELERVRERLDSWEKMATVGLKVLRYYTDDCNIGVRSLQALQEEIRHMSEEFLRAIVMLQESNLKDWWIYPDDRTCITVTEKHQIMWGIEYLLDYITKMENVPEEDVYKCKKEADRIFTALYGEDAENPFTTSKTSNEQSTGQSDVESESNAPTNV